MCVCVCQKFEVPREKAISLLLGPEEQERSEGKDLKVAYHLIYDAKRMYEHKGTLSQSNQIKSNQNHLTRERERERESFSNIVL